MLPRSFRFPLRESTEFFLEPSIVRAAHIRAFVQPLEHSGLQCAVIVRKTHGKAHDRAKTRRRVRAVLTSLFQNRSELFTAPYAVAFVIQGRPQPYSLYEQEITSLLEQLALRPHPQSSQGA